MKVSLKNYLRSQEQFKDYDYDGSDMAVLLDILAYNTSKNAFYLNMDFAESFLDSAQLRSSIVSRAKDLNYLPRSFRSSVAKVHVEFQATGLSQPYIIPKGSSFATLIKNQSFVFSIAENITISSSNTTYSFDTYIYEGVYLKDTYSFNKTYSTYKISNKSVDTDSIVVTVFEDGKVIGDQYTKATSLLDLNSTSKVYFIQASDNGGYEIVFGNGITGYTPKNESLIIIDYRVSQGSKANGAKLFVQNFDPTAPFSEMVGEIKITTLQGSANGDEPETNESIRFNAPRHFQTQERGVIPSDYETLLKQEFPEINQVSAIGGEDLTPPQYGKVFVAVDLQNFVGELPEIKKQQYINFLKDKAPSRVVILSPEYAFLEMVINVRYNSTLTNMTASSIRTLVALTINQYFYANMNKFGAAINPSILQTLIDEADPSIISNTLDYRIYKKIISKLSPYINNLEVKFEFPIENNNNLPTDLYQNKQASRMLIGKKHALVSNAFTFNGIVSKIHDDNIGNLRIAQNDGNYDKRILDIGTIDYETGLLRMNNFTIDSLNGQSFLEFIAYPREKDLTINKKQLLKLESDRVTINVIPSNG